VIGPAGTLTGEANVTSAKAPVSAAVVMGEGLIICFGARDGLVRGGFYTTIIPSGAYTIVDIEIILIAAVVSFIIATL
jgi:hypothetical protein